MNLTPQEAEVAVGRMFPGHRVYVADGAEEYESGVVEDQTGKSIASFRLIYKLGPLDSEIPVIREIRIGQPGQFCGTVDEIRQFEEQYATE